MKKKMLALFLTAAMVVSVTACGSETSAPTESSAPATTEAATETTDEASAETSTEVVNEEPHGQLIIGDITETSGDYTPYWTNAASDYAVFKTVAGQPQTVRMDRDGLYEYNTDILESYEETENEDGTKTWTFKIKDGLKWSNGDPMTAKDFALTPMLWGSRVATVDLQATNGVTTCDRYEGFAEYNSGESKAFKGVHLDEANNTFSITISAEWLPYYYGKSLASVYPTYMKGWLPEDVELIETEEGLTFSDNFTAEHIAETVERERWTPSACCGPYVLDSYDKSNYSYTMSVNPNYVGDMGKQPSIQTVVYKTVGQDTMMDQLKTGGVDLLVQLTDASEINAGLDMVEAGTHDYTSYDRNGYGQLIFKCDRGPTQFVEVRQAIAYLLDRNEFTKTFTGGHGSVVNGPYGTAQWMVEESEEQLETLNSYSYSPEKAVELLEKGGWTLNADGGEYKEGDGVRYKDVDGQLMPLKIKWCSSENNSVSDLLVTMLQQNPDVAAAGIEIEQNIVTFTELLANYYDQKDNDYNMFNMAEGFSVPYDVKQQYMMQTETGDWGYNYNHIADEQLTKLASDMNSVPEGDDEAYLNVWFGFIQRWNELLPNLPLYSNEYLDVYNTKVKNWDRDDIWGVENALIYATVEE